MTETLTNCSVLTILGAGFQYKDFTLES